MKPLRILVVEDELLVAMDIEFMLEDAGHIVVGAARSSHEVDELEEALTPDIAFVDVQLDGAGSGLDAMTTIRSRWPDAITVFLTANPAKIPSDLCGAHGVISKPFTRNGFASALAYLHDGIVDPPPRLSLPQSFVPAQSLASAWSRPRQT